ncbi:MAG: PIN domain-containing protein [Thermoanaerobaculia bacterium]
MRGLDTNILLRAILEDDPEQSPIAARILTEAQERGERLHVSVTVLCELLWTLRGRPYRFDRAALADLLDSLLTDELFEIQDRDLVVGALNDFRQGRADFADYLIGWQDRKAGCLETLTFDRKMRDQEGFLVLSL